MWRASNPALPEAERQRLVDRLMDARRAVAAAECAFKHARHLLLHGETAAAPLCKVFHYVDGAVIHAGRLLSDDSPWT